MLCHFEKIKKHSIFWSDAMWDITIQLDILWEDGP